MMHARNESSAAAPRVAGLVRVFESTAQAQAAIARLEQGGFDIAKASLIAREEPSALHQVGMAVAGARATVWGRHAALWRRLCENPAALALAWVPFIGYVMAVGPAALVLIGARWQSAPQASPLARMLQFAGMSPGERRTYEAAVRGGQILLIVHGAGAEVARARQLLSAALAAACRAHA